MTTLFAWFDSWRMFAYMVIPLGVIASGASPIDAPGSVFVPAFAITLGIQFVALRLLARGHYPPVLSMLFEVLRMPAVLPATLTLLRRDVRRPFWVTPKGQSTRSSATVPRLLTVLAAASSAGIAWFVLSAFGLTPTEYDIPGAAIGAGLFVAVNLALLLGAISRIRAARFAGDRRASVRFTVRLPAHLSGRPCLALDVSLTGAQVVVPTSAAPLADRPLLEIEVDDASFRLRCEVRRVREQGDGSTLVGLAFAEPDRATVSRLALCLFRADETSWRAHLPGIAPQRRSARSAASEPAV
jgi:hypothetical protein